MTLIDQSPLMPSTTIEVSQAIAHEPQGIVGADPHQAAHDFLVSFAKKFARTPLERRYLQTAIDLSTKSQTICAPDDREALRMQYVNYFEERLRHHSDLTSKHTDQRLVQLNKSLHDLTDRFDLPGRACARS